jgi:hypothetical protein
VLDYAHGAKHTVDSNLSTRCSSGSIEGCAILLTPYIEPKPIAPQTSAQQTFTVAEMGLLTGDIVEVIKCPVTALIPAGELHTFESGLLYAPAEVYDDGNLLITFANFTEQVQYPSQGQYTVRVTRPRRPLSSVFNNTQPSVSRGTSRNVALT